MHLCQDEINALLNALPFVEPIALYAKSLALCVLSRPFHKPTKSARCQHVNNGEPRKGA